MCGPAGAGFTAPAGAPSGCGAAGMHAAAVAAVTGGAADPSKTSPTAGVRTGAAGWAGDSGVLEAAAAAAVALLGVEAVPAAADGAAGAVADAILFAVVVEPGPEEVVDAGAAAGAAGIFRRLAQELPPVFAP